MDNITKNIDEYIKFERLFKQISEALKMPGAKTPSPCYEITRILKEQTKNKIKTLLTTQNNEAFYEYMVVQKQKSKALKQNMPEYDFIIDFGKISYQDISLLKLFYIVSHKQAVSATFDVSQKQIDLMILNNNNIINTLEEQLHNSTLIAEQFDEIEDLIYSIKIKNELYKHIYSHL